MTKRPEQGKQGEAPVASKAGSPEKPALEPAARGGDDNTTETETGKRKGENDTVIFFFRGTRRACDAPLTSGTTKTSSSSTMLPKQSAFRPTAKVRMTMTMMRLSP